MYFEPINFVNNLKYMGIGMLGIFLIVGVIAVATYVINRVANKYAKKKNEQDKKE